MRPLPKREELPIRESIANVEISNSLVGRRNRLCHILQGDKNVEDCTSSASNVGRRRGGWIPGIPNDMPITKELICEIHRRIITGADDDHCGPGLIRRQDHNVHFGSPQHRGAAGGAECNDAFDKMMEAVEKGFREHDVLVQALALHYHFAAMHRFGDGNGRTARALEALLLQRAGMRDSILLLLCRLSTMTRRLLI